VARGSLPDLRPPIAGCKGRRKGREEKVVEGWEVVGNGGNGMGGG